MEDRKSTNERNDNERYNHRKKMKFSNVSKEVNHIRDIIIAMKAREAIPAYNVYFQGEDFHNSLMECYASLGCIDNKKGSPSSSLHQLNESGQTVKNSIIQFLFEAVDFYGEDREIVAVAINYLDRFLITRMRHDNENIVPTNIISHSGESKMMILDIYVFASLGLAIKLFSPCSGCPFRGEARRHEEMKAREYYRNHTKPYNQSNDCVLCLPSSEIHTQVYSGLGYKTFAQITGGDEEIIKNISKAEGSLLSTLQWYMHPPTCASFIHYIFQLLSPSDNPRLLPFWQSLKDLAFFQVELVLGNPLIICRFAPSIIAVAAVINSLHRHLIPCLSQNNTPCRDVLETVKLLLDQVEKTFNISHEFDERILTVRGLLTNQLMGFWRKDDLFVEKKKCENTIVSKANFQHDGNNSFQQTEHTWHRWEPCQMVDHCLDNLLLSATNEKSASLYKGRNESDLIAHYNEYIRPKLYQVNGKDGNSSNAVPNTFCNAIVTNDEIPQICNFDELEC